MVEFIVGIILGVALTLVISSFWVKTIEDNAPIEDSPKNRWMKLQNEGGKYVKMKDGKVKIKILK